MASQQSLASAIARSQRPTAAAAATPDSPLPPSLESMFLLISEPVLRLHTAQNREMTLREISILLGDVLDLLQEDHRIAAAADGLYEAAFALQSASDKRSTCTTVTDRLMSAEQ